MNPEAKGSGREVSRAFRFGFGRQAGSRVGVVLAVGALAGAAILGLRSHDDSLARARREGRIRVGRAIAAPYALLQAEGLALSAPTTTPH
jgi:hypothetical protein